MLTIEQTDIKIMMLPRDYYTTFYKKVKGSNRIVQ